MKKIAAIALTASVVIFGGVEDHGFQGLNREPAPIVSTETN